jgi:hypothetical protein
MKLHPSLLLAAVPLSLAIACGGSPDESVGDLEAANTSDAGPAADGGSATDGAATDAGSPLDCAAIPSGPFQPQSLGQVFSGSEDFAFDGRGHIVGKRGNTLAVVGTDGVTNLAELPGQTFGLRYSPNGDVIAAIPGAGKLVAVSPTGQVTDYATGLGGPNGVFVDFAGNVFVTEFGGSKVTRISADDKSRTVLVSGTATAQAANGVVLDANKSILFYTEYQKGKVHRLSMSDPAAAPVQVASIPGTRLDGMVLDACGNVYVVDQGSSRLFRIKVDATGTATAAPELLATFPTNVANAQFGAGPGFNPKVLYVTGNPGTVYGVAVGVPGAPVAAPPAEPVDPVDPVDPAPKPE